MGGLLTYILVAGTAAVLAYVLTPVVRWVAVRYDAVDRPGGRKVHAIATPTLGGLAMFLGFMGALALSSRLFHQLFASSEAAGVAIGASLMTAIGIVDDVKGLTAPAKLAAQIFAASIMTLAGVQVLYFWVPSFGTPAPLISALLFGVCVGFLPHNFNPARIFMGDSGSMLLGTLLSGATITGIGRTTQPQAADQFALLIPVAIPILVLALPFIDTLFAVGRRMRAGKGIMTADKNHLHDRLLEMGHSHRKAVLILYAWSALLAGSAVALSFIGATRVLPYFLTVVVAGVIGLLAPRWRAGRQGRV